MCSDNLRSRKTRLQTARLYLITGATQSQPTQTIAAVVAAALRGGVNIVQLREKDRTDAELAPVAHTLRTLCKAADALFIVNDRPDLAVAWNADGVHIGQDDMSVVKARAIVGPDRIVGLSTHSPAQIDAANALGDQPSVRLDYIGVGPVYETPTKAGRPAVGMELVRYAATSARLPWFAIGGVNATNAGVVTTAGAKRLAVVRAITTAPDPEAATRALRALV